MNKIFKFFPVAFAAFALASCNSDDLMSFGQDADAIPEVGANEAYATLDFDGTTTRSGVNIGTGEHAGKYQLTWSTGDKFNLYSTNSLKFNTYTLKDGAGTAKGTFKIEEGDAANLSDQFTDESVANSLYAVMDDSGKGLTHSFFSDAKGQACVSVEIPKRFKQVAGAVASEDNATALCMPAFAKGVKVNAQGGVTASFSAMAGLLAIDAGKLSAHAKGVVVVAKGITGTFEACLDDENPPSVKADSRYTYGNYIQVDFDAEMTDGGTRFIYVPIPEGSYKGLNVYEFTGVPTGDAYNNTDALTPAFEADGSITSVAQNAGWTVNTTAIISKTDYEVVRGMNEISQAVAYTPSASEVNSWLTLSKYLYDKMDGSHSITVTITNPSTWTDNTLYIPVNSGKTKSSIEIVVPDVAKLTNASAGDVLNIVEASYNPATNAAENATTATSTSDAFVKEVKLKLQGTTETTTAVNAYLPTSSFVMEVPTTTKTLSGAVTAITADKGLFVNGAGTYESVTTVEEKNTGAITVGTGATVNELTLTKGDGAVTIGGTAKLVADNISHASNITIKGTLSDESAYGATGATNDNRNSGNIIFADGATNVELTNYGSGTITAGKLATGYGTIVQKGNGAVTIGKAGSTDEDVSDVTVTAITMEGTGALTVQNISGEIAAINLKATSTSAVTLNNLGDIKADDGDDNTTEGIIIATGKSAVINATDAVIGKLENNSTATSTLNTYGSTALGKLTDTNNKVTINAYYTGKAAKAAPSGTPATIFTAGQLAALKAGGTYEISPRVAIMYLGGAKNPWVGPSINANSAFSLDGNNVKIQGMNLSATDVTGDKKINENWAESVGLFRKISGTGAVTIKELDLSDVYLKTSKADLNNIGILIGSYTSSGALTVGGAAADAVKITDVEAIEAAGNNVGGLIGYYAGGNATFDAVTLSASKIQTSGHNVGGLIGYQYAGNVTVGENVAVNVTVPAIKGAYALGGMIGSNRATADIKKAQVNVKFGLTQQTSYFSTSELKGYCGSVNNLVGLVYGDVTSAKLDDKVKITNKLITKDKSDLLFHLNTMTSASGATRYFVGGNDVVGVVKSGTITVDGTVYAAGTNYNKYEAQE